MKRRELEALAVETAEVLKERMPPGAGYILLVFDFGAAGNLAYASTADRRDAIATMREWIRTMERS